MGFLIAQIFAVLNSKSVVPPGGVRLGSYEYKDKLRVGQHCDDDADGGMGLLEGKKKIEEQMRLHV